MAFILAGKGFGVWEKAAGVDQQAATSA
ncbi:hypothetical protein PBAL39_15074 [Pedobacter sp. BAL39]|nr:hypothetical protein PBAL39_15074 [Pedobacter sp. BAL39]